MRMARAARMRCRVLVRRGMSWGFAARVDAVRCASAATPRALTRRTSSRGCSALRAGVVATINRDKKAPAS